MAQDHTREKAPHRLLRDRYHQMIRKKFEDVANQLGCKYDYSEERHVSFISRNIPTSYHTLSLEYKNVNIELQYEFGGQNLAWINSSMKCDKKMAGFTVNSRTQIKRLFSRDKNPFTVKSDDPKLASFILKTLEEVAYNELAQNTTFEPTITGVNNDGHFTLRTDFYLGFKNKEQSILPSIHFHKKLIDEVMRSAS